QPFAVGTQPVSVAAADVNRDGLPDLLVANAGTGGPSTVSVLLNTTPLGAATPSFAPAQPFGVGRGPQSVAAADVNHDGRPDLLVANTGDGPPGTVSVLMNTCSELTLGLPPAPLLTATSTPTLPLTAMASPMATATPTRTLTP